jgi:hypothetical protein
MHLQRSTCYWCCCHWTWPSAVQVQVQYELVLVWYFQEENCQSGPACFIQRKPDWFHRAGHSKTVHSAVMTRLLERRKKTQNVAQILASQYVQVRTYCSKVQSACNSFLAYLAKLIAHTRELKPLSIFTYLAMYLFTGLSNWLQTITAPVLNANQSSIRNKCVLVQVPVCRTVRQQTPLYPKCVQYCTSLSNSETPDFRWSQKVEYQVL